MVKRELSVHEFEAIKSSLAESIARKKESGGAAERGSDTTVKAAQAWGPPGAEDAAVEEQLLEMLGAGTLFIELDD